MKHWFKNALILGKKSDFRDLPLTVRECRKSFLFPIGIIHLVSTQNFPEN